MLKKPNLSPLLRHWPLKLLSLLISISLWYVIVVEDQVDMTMTIPLEMRNLPADMLIANQYKKDIEVSVRGSKRRLQEIRQQNLSRPVNLADAEPGTVVIQNTLQSIPFPRGVTVQRVQPSNITLMIDKLVQKEFGINAITKGKPSAGFTLESIKLNPGSIRVSGPQTLLDKVDVIHTQPIDVDGLSHSLKVQAHLKLSEAMLKLIGETVVEAELTISEPMVKKTVRNIPINIKDGDKNLRLNPPVVTVDANIPEQIVRETPELALLFRAWVSPESGNDQDGNLSVRVNGVSLPGHSDIVILQVRPPSVRLVQ